MAKSSFFFLYTCVCTYVFQSSHIMHWVYHTVSVMSRPRSRRCIIQHYKIFRYLLYHNMTMSSIPNLDPTECESYCHLWILKRTFSPFTVHSHLCLKVSHLWELSNLRESISTLLPSNICLLLLYFPVLWILIKFSCLKRGNIWHTPSNAKFLEAAVSLT